VKYQNQRDRYGTFGAFGLQVTRCRGRIRFLVLARPIQPHTFRPTLAAGELVDNELVIDFGVLDETARRGRLLQAVQSLVDTMPIRGTVIR
jgi:hypothetical protein